jgi:RNA polymerase sigma-70 factor (ECF subfamily)
MKDSRNQSANFSKDICNGRLSNWFERWNEPMQRWVASRSLIPAADLDDIAQEAFLRLLRYSDNVAVQYPQTYLFRIAANVASEWRERARNSRPHDDSWLEDLQIESEDEPENKIARIHLRENVRAALRRLPQRQLQVLLLHIDDSLTYVQIAERLGLTRRVVKRDLALAYSYLRCELDSCDLEE